MRAWAAGVLSRRVVAVALASCVFLVAAVHWWSVSVALASAQRPPQRHQRRRDAAAAAAAAVEDDERGDLVLAVLVLRTTVAVARHEERMAAIRDTWGSVKRCGPTSTRGLREGAQGIRVEMLEVRAGGFMEALEALSRREAVSWVAKGDDITFWNMAALCERVRAPDLDGGLRLVGNLLATSAGDPSSRFVSGGAGFVMPRALLLGLAGADRGTCARKADAMALGDDVAVAKCAMELGAELLDDASFNAFGPMRCLFHSFHDWYSRYKANVGLSEARCAAPFTTFHYVEAPLARLLWQCQQDSCPDLTAEAWPHGLGGYLKRPRSDDDVAGFRKAFFSTARAGMVPM